METKVSKKYQVVIPKKARQQMGLREGQILYTYVIDGNLFLSPEKKWPNDYIGLGKEIWGKIDVAKYIEEERSNWE